LGRLGERKPDIYGSVSLKMIEEECFLLCKAAGWDLKNLQSDSESEIIRFIDEHRNCDAVVINPGALMVSGWPLRDCLEDFEGIKVEVHITNIFARESFRHVSVISPIMQGSIHGLGTLGYTLAINYILSMIQK